jgi:hypothetical protein
LIVQAEKLLERNSLREAEQAANEAVRLSLLLRKERLGTPLPSDAQRGGRSDLPPLFVQGYLRSSIRDVLARIYSRRGEYEQAAALFGFSGTMNLNVAVALVKTGRIAEARKPYKDVHVLAYHPDFKPYMPGSASARAMEATIFLGRGIIDFDQQRYGSATWALLQA